MTLYLKKMDTFIAQLVEQSETKETPAAPRTGARHDGPLPARRRLRVHCDNHYEGVGDDCNGRRVTAIVYLNEGWVEAHGGELLLYQAPPNHNSTLCRAPKLGSVILFWSTIACCTRCCRR